MAAQAAQEVEEAADGGAAGAAALPVLQQGGGGVGPRLQPPDLQVLAAQLLRQRRPVGGGRRPRVEVEAEAAPHAVVKRHHGHGVEVGRRRDAAGSGARRRRGHGRSRNFPPPPVALSLLASPRLAAASRPPPAGSARPPRRGVRGSFRGARRGGLSPLTALEAGLPRKEANYRPVLGLRSVLRGDVGQTPETRDVGPGRRFCHRGNSAVPNAVFLCSPPLSPPKSPHDGYMPAQPPHTTNGGIINAALAGCPLKIT